MDEYKIQSYPENFFDYFIDLGACVGNVSKMVAKKNPKAVIVAYEPCIENYEQLVANTRGLNITTVNEALGDGRLLFFKNLGRKDRHLFLRDGTGDYSVKSNSLEFIFDKHKIDINKICCLKIDCEGGESFLIDNILSEEIMKKCYHVALEVHFKHRGDKNTWLNVFPEWHVYDDWIHRVFDNTHTILYWKSNRYLGHGIYIMERKHE